MGPKLTALVNLQTIDGELRKARKRLKMGTQAVTKQQQHIAELEGALAAKNDEIKLTRVQAGKLELELQTKDEEINKLRVALNVAKSNKDYSAILTQLNINKADKSRLEDQILALMTQVDTDRTGCTDVETEITSEQEHLDQIMQKVEEKQKSLKEGLAKLESQYSQACQEVPDKERNLFVRLAERFDGEDVTEVTELNARRAEYGCGGCFMKIPREMVNSLMSRDDVVICPTCGRILVLELNQTGQPTA